MTLEQKVGQLMIIGWQSDNVDDIVDLIKEFHFGNIILFTRNIKSANQLRLMTSKIQEASLKYNGVKAFIAIDQEGGNVRRIYGDVTNVPGHMAIGAASNYNPSAAYQVGKILGEELKDLGVNFNLAPVADINSNPYNPVIGIRSFSDDPYQVSKLASGFAKGLEENNVLSSYKHFIGHGNVIVDSHLDLPHLNTSYEELRKVELIPYTNKSFQPSAIMTAHILYSEIDDRFPATISRKIIHDVLRKELGFKGIVVTDCFEMDAITRAFSLSEVAIFALKATVDLIMVSHTFGRQLTVRNSIINAVQTGSITMEEIDERVNNVLKHKEVYTKEQNVIVDYDKNRKIANEISLSSITLVSGKPFEIDDNTIVIGVTNYLNSIAEDKNVENMDISKILAKEFNIPYRSIDSKNFNVNEISTISKGKKVILALSDSHITLVQKVLYTQLIQRQEEVMLISLRTPYDVLQQVLPTCHYAIYEYTKQSVNSLIQVLRGSPALGKLPVNISGKGKNDIQGVENHLVRQVLSYIEESYAKNINLTDISEELNVTKEHLSRLVKSVTNINFKDHVNNVRIRHAKSLLGTTTLMIYEVGYLCGYSDPSYFTKKFISVVGISPLEYRNQYKD